MADKKKRRRRIEMGEDAKCTKEEYAIAKYLRSNAPIKQGKLAGMTVQCFIASKAVDALLDSKWSKGKSKDDVLFTDRKSCVAYLDTLLLKELFHRAEKVERKKDKSKKKKTKDEDQTSINEESKEKRSKKDKKGKKDKEIDKENEKSEDLEKKKVEDEKKNANEKKDVEKKDEKKEGDKKKKEKKLKLNMHNDQRFVDGDEVYVWIYDPVPAKTFIIGLLMVLGAIGLCMFPLWPDEVRIGVYYISLAGASFVGVILLLIIIRFILFCIMWVLTVGGLHFWLLPNLTEDVGFFDSFRPLYTYERFPGGKDTDKKGKCKKNGKKKEDTESEPENDGEVQDGEKGEEGEGEDQEQEGSQEEEVIDYDEDDDLEILEDEDDGEAENLEVKKEK